MTKENDPAGTATVLPPADGRPATTAARTFDAFLRMVEDGKLNADLSNALIQINETLNNHVLEYGGAPKASLDLKFNFTLKGGIFEITDAYKVTLPAEPRARTIAWSTERNEFTPQNPKQGQLFGVRDA